MTLLLKTDTKLGREQVPCSQDSGVRSQLHLCSRLVVAQVGTVELYLAFGLFTNVFLAGRFTTALFAIETHAKVKRMNSSTRNTLWLVEI